MRKRLVIPIAVALVAGAVTVVLGTVADATPASNFSTQQISLGHFDEFDVHTNNELPNQVKLKTKGKTDVYVVQNTVKPGGSSGWHTHPGPSMITVTAGVATFYDSDDPSCTPHVVQTGEGYIDPGDGHVHILRNEGSVDLITTTVQIVPAGAARRIDAPNPGNCPF
jgi:oxalate decarboxylase/phosphoglucose isomerase-like protein (cupin superfamily)